MTENESFTVKDQESLWWSEFKELKWRDKKSLSELIVIACKEYYENHKDGNEQMTLDDPIIATPSMFRPYKIIENYMMSCKENEFESHKFKLQEWLGAFKKRYGVYPYEV